jgi:uncharacterized membrane protein
VTQTSGVAPVRWVGVDAARGLAVLGMMAAHTWPRDASQSELLVDGRPSVLFAVVAGISIGIVAGGSTEGHRTKIARGRLAVRAGVLVVLGVLLWMLPSGIAVILDYYGVMFVLLAPLLFAPSWLLAGLAAALLSVAPLVRDQVVELTGAVPSGPLDGAPNAAEIARDYLVTGYYPALLWLPLLLIGLGCARLGFASTRVRVLLVGVGAVASVVGYGAAVVLPRVDTTAHSGSTAELLGAGGLAVALVGVALLTLDSPSPQLRRVGRWCAAPLTALGRVALTVYVAHVIIIAALSPLGPAGQFDAGIGIPLLAVLATGGIALGMACQAQGRRAPLEWLLAAAADAAFRPDPATRVRD